MSRTAPTTANAMGAIEPKLSAIVPVRVEQQHDAERRQHAAGDEQQPVGTLAVHDVVQALLRSVVVRSAPVATTGGRCRACG